jgi:hypothetical protein
VKLFSKICHLLFYPISIIGLAILLHSCERETYPFTNVGYFAPLQYKITQSEAYLNGIVRDATSAYLEYGTSISYGKTASAGSCSLETDPNTSCQSWIGHVHIVGLNPGTTYHYRAVAKYKRTTYYSGDNTFTTLP